MLLRLSGLFLVGGLALAPAAGCTDRQTESPMKEAVEMEEIITKEVFYSAAGKQMTGYLARPAHAAGNLPAVLVVHEWWGQTDYPRRRAEMLAKEGYIAFAVDMFGDRAIADHPKKAGEFASAVMKSSENVAEPFEAALNTLRKVDGVDPRKVAAIGYCFGGGVVLEMARQGKDLAGVVSFHGSLTTPTTAKAGVVKAEMLVLNGAADPFIKAEQIDSFKKEMEAAKAKFKFVNYPGAVHGFTNPEADINGEKFNLPLAYNKTVDEQSWSEMKTFFDRVLR